MDDFIISLFQFLTGILIVSLLLLAILRTIRGIWNTFNRKH